MRRYNGLTCEEYVEAMSRWLRQQENMANEKIARLERELKARFDKRIIEDLIYWEGFKRGIQTARGLLPPRRR